MSVPVLLWDPGVCRPVAPPVPELLVLLEGVGLASGGGGGDSVTLFIHWPTPLHDVPLGQICTPPSSSIEQPPYSLTCIPLRKGS